MTLEEQIVANGVKNLREFGYPNCDASNIMTDAVFSQFFASMLKENKGRSKATDQAIDELLAEIKG